MDKAKFSPADPDNPNLYWVLQKYDYGDAKPDYFITLRERVTEKVWIFRKVVIYNRGSANLTLDDLSSVERVKSIILTEHQRRVRLEKENGL